MDDTLFQRINAGYRRLVARYGTRFGMGPPPIPAMAYKGFNDAMDGVGLYEPGWA